MRLQPTFPGATFDTERQRAVVHAQTLARTLAACAPAVLQ
jgi:hypothetical protein